MLFEFYRRTDERCNLGASRFDVEEISTRPLVVKNKMTTETSRWNSPQ